jgi:uncharacterized protein YaaW (UPF0174 family)
VNLKQLRHLEIKALNSNMNHIHEYGLAYRDILRKCEQNARFKLSEEMQISDMAKEYLKELEQEFEITHKDNLKLRAKACSELFIRSTVTFEELYSILMEARTLDLDKIKKELFKHPKYIEISPKVTMEVINFIKLNLET